ncbi:MAG: hypothetical protein ACOY3K_01460 [Candidatus Omnitrophota bacterium]
MKQSEISAWRKKYRITRLELAATVGLLPSYLEKLENEECPALESDLTRIEEGFRALVEIKKEMDSDREP